MKTFAGYINLKPINGVIFPSYAQNQMNKDFIVNKLQGQFFLATNENTYGKNNIVLISLIKEKVISGIVIISTFSLPDSYEDRLNIYNLTIKYKKKLFFIFEELTLKNKKDISTIEDSLIYRSQFFTHKKTALTSEEKLSFIDPSWNLV
jgi:sporadic carbohydrate cluster protein (TIGR04323 family)